MKRLIELISMILFLLGSTAFSGSALAQNLNLYEFEVYTIQTKEAGATHVHITFLQILMYKR